MSLSGTAQTIIGIIIIIILLVILIILLDRYLLFVGGGIDLDSDNMEYNLDPGRIISILNNDNNDNE